MYEIEFTDKAKKQFDKIEKDLQERIGSVFGRIRIRPEQFVERLIGEEGYKLRVGDYRVFLDILHEKLIILVIEMGHRKKVYKN